jgi:hypothetical protein
MKYKFTLEKDFTYSTEIKNKSFTGRDLLGKIWVIIDKRGDVVVKAGYAWDGTTLSPDFKETYYPSLVHDALYQFLENGMPFTRKEIDDLFLKMMQENNFKYAKIYYRAVRLFGGIFVKLTR